MIVSFIVQNEIGQGFVGFEHVKVGLYGLLRTLRWITKISILQAEEQMLD